MTEGAGLLGLDPVGSAAALRQIKEKLWLPHSGGQADVLQSKARFRILRAGRRWGKTQVAAHEVFMAALKHPGEMVWWVSNSDRNVRRGYRATKAQIPRGLLAKDPPSDEANSRYLTLTNGSLIEFYTAGSAGKSEASDSSALTGEGVNFLVMDEAALIHENVWYQHLRPTLSDTHGRALIISTPRGRNWFWKMVKRAERGGEYEAFHFRSIDSPYMDAEEIADAEETLPRVLYEQEYLAKFSANAASIFSFADDQVVNIEAPEGHVVLGVDLAKKEDWTVLSAANAETRRPCHFERLNETSWPIQEELIMEVARDLDDDPMVDHVTIVIDSTGVGDVVNDHLEDAGLDVIPINFGSGMQKERMVRLYAADLEHKRAFLTEDEVEEHESYEFNITPSGRYQFEAATGHDDMVAARLLQHWGIVHEGPPEVRVSDGDEGHDEYEDETPSEPLVPDSVSDMMARPEVWS